MAIINRASGSIHSIIGINPQRDTNQLTRDPNQIPIWRNVLLNFGTRLRKQFINSADNGLDLSYWTACMGVHYM